MPAGRGDAVVIISEELMTIAKKPVAACGGLSASRTVIAAKLVPGVSGVPVMVPVFGFMASPGGRPVADQASGAVPPVALTVAL